MFRGVPRPARGLTTAAEKQSNFIAALHDKKINLVGSRAVRILDRQKDANF